MTSIRAQLRARLVAGVGSRNIDVLREAFALLGLAAGRSLPRGGDTHFIAWPPEESGSTRRVRRLLLFAGEVLPPGTPLSWLERLDAGFPRARHVELVYAGALDPPVLETLSQFLACRGANTSLRYLLDDRAISNQAVVEAVVGALGELGSARVSVTAAVRPGQIGRLDVLLDLARGKGLPVRLVPSPNLLAMAQLEGRETECYDAQLLFFRAGSESTDFSYRYACTRVREALSGGAEYRVEAIFTGVPPNLAWLFAVFPRPSFADVRRFVAGEFDRRVRFRCRSLVHRARKVVRNDAGGTATARGRVLIVGWYGTETIGDKAILATELTRLRERPDPPTEIQLASFHPFVTRNTLRELGVSPEGVRIVRTYTREFRDACENAGEIVMAGGPLMDIEALNHILYAFMCGARHGACLRVAGCGIGPLKASVYTEAVGHILRLATTITLRDSAAVERCRDQFGRPDAELVADPARDFVLSTDVVVKPEDSPVVACFLRKWPGSFARVFGREEFPALRKNLERELEAMLADCVTRLGAELRLYPMHCFHVGGDDRRFNRALARRLARRFGVNARVVNRPVSPSEIMAAMSTADLAVCMRYHSVVFAEALGTPFVAIDYTLGGKVAGFLEDIGRTDRMVQPGQLARGEWTEFTSRLSGSRFGRSDEQRGAGPRA